MIFYNSLIGLPIFFIEQNENIKLGMVKDVLYSCEEDSINSFVIQHRTLISYFKYLPFIEVCRITKTAIFAKSKSSIKTIIKNNNVKEFLKGNNQYCIKNEIYSSEGDKIGIINDIAFDGEFGKINYFIISDGFFEDLISGRKMVKISKAKHFGNKIIINNIDIY